MTYSAEQMISIFKQAMDMASDAEIAEAFKYDPRVNFTTVIKWRKGLEFPNEMMIQTLENLIDSINYARSTRPDKIDYEYVSTQVTIHARTSAYLEKIAKQYHVYECLKNSNGNPYEFICYRITNFYTEKDCVVVELTGDGCEFIYIPKDFLSDTSWIVEKVDIEVFKEQKERALYEKLKKKFENN